MLLSFGACLHPMKKINLNVVQNKKKPHLIVVLEKTATANRGLCVRAFWWESRIALTLGVSLVQAGLRAEVGRGPGIHQALESDVKRL